MNYFSEQEQKTLLIDKLKNKECFSLNRFGEGEIRILSRRKHNNKFECILTPKTWSVDEETDKWFFEHLEKAYDYEHPTYLKLFQDKGYNKNLNFIDIKYKNYKKLTTSSFYKIFKNFYLDLLPLIINYENINFVCNKKANIKNLKIDIKNVWNNFDEYNSWKQQEYMNKVINDISKLKNNVILFSTGFSTKLMIYELHKINNNNVYLDCGSIFDYLLLNKKTRTSNIIKTQ